MVDWVSQLSERQFPKHWLVCNEIELVKGNCEIASKDQAQFLWTAVNKWNISFFQIWSEKGTYQRYPRNPTKSEKTR